MIPGEVEVEVGKEYAVIVPPIEKYCEKTGMKGVVLGKDSWHPGKEGDKIKLKKYDFVLMKVDGVRMDIRAEDLRELK